MRQRLTKAELAVTVATYRRLKDTNRVGYALGISGASVRYRLAVAGEPMRHPGGDASDRATNLKDLAEVRRTAAERHRRWRARRGAEGDDAPGA